MKLHKRLFAALKVKIPLQAPADNYVSGIRHGFEIMRNLISSAVAKSAKKEFHDMVLSKKENAKGDDDDKKKKSALKAITAVVKKDVGKKAPKKDAKAKRLAAQIISGKILMKDVPESEIKAVRDDLKNYIDKMDKKTPEQKQPHSERISRVEAALAE